MLYWLMTTRCGRWCRRNAVAGELASAITASTERPRTYENLVVGSLEIGQCGRVKQVFRCVEVNADGLGIGI